MKFVVALLIGLTFFSPPAGAGASMHNPLFCYANDTVRSMKKMMSIQFHNSQSICFDPSRIWYLGRYGTRLPQTESILRMLDFAESSIRDDIVSNYEAGRTTLCQQDYENIRDYAMLDSYFGRMLRIENAELEAEAGVFAAQNISRRYQQAFPDILTDTYIPSRFHFRHAGSARTNDSIRAFATGLFGETGAANVVYEPVPEFDWFLRPLGFCLAFSEEVRNWSRQQDAFVNRSEILQMVQQVNSKLGLHGSRQMNFSQIHRAMWNWSRFEVAVTFETSGSETGGNSPWCAPFSVAHHLLLEYWEDLGFFYRYAYGMRNQRLLQNLNCGRFQDLLSHMQSESDADTKARIFFTHTEEIQAMLVALGAFRDVSPLHQHNFAQQTGRHWSTSLISPFSANLAVVRFNCDDGDHDLMFLLNERPILLPGCDQQNGVCKLSVIVNRFQRFVDADCSTFFCSSD